VRHLLVNGFGLLQTAGPMVLQGDFNFGRCVFPGIFHAGFFGLGGTGRWLYAAASDCQSKPETERLFTVCSKSP
jgi:hypothetical protein